MSEHQSGQHHSGPQYSGQQYPGQQYSGQQDPGQQYSYPGYPYPAAATTNTMAVVSLILSITGLSVLPVLGSIAGVITGHMARRQIAERGEGGGGFATAGLVVGYVGIALAVLAVVAIILFVVGFSTMAVPTDSF